MNSSLLPLSSLLLCRVIQNVIDHLPKLHYLVAVDDSVHTLEDFVKVRYLGVIY